MSDIDRKKEYSTFQDVYSGWKAHITETYTQLYWKGLLPPADYENFLLTLDSKKISLPISANFILLARGGWYPHGSMTLRLLRALSSDIKKGEFQSADVKMIAFLEETYEITKSHILTELPTRSPVLERAFKAHELGEYALSVPVFLIQSDGICYEIAKVQLYSKRDRKPKIASVIDKIDIGIVTKAFMSPIATNIPLTADVEERRDPNFPVGALNRHQILHGESIDYGTKINSLKSISLLNYICDIRESLSI